MAECHICSQECLLLPVTLQASIHPQRWKWLSALQINLGYCKSCGRHGHAADPNLLLRQGFKSTLVLPQEGAGDHQLGEGSGLIHPKSLTWLQRAAPSLSAAEALPFNGPNRSLQQSSMTGWLWTSRYMSLSVEECTRTCAASSRTVQDSIPASKSPLMSSYSHDKSSDPHLHS